MALIILKNKHSYPFLNPTSMSRALEIWKWTEKNLPKYSWAWRLERLHLTLSLTMSKLWIFALVLCVELVSILMPIFPKELKHEIFNRSHLNSKLRLRRSFWFSPFFLYSCKYYMFSWKNVFLLDQTLILDIHITFYFMLV